MSAGDLGRLRALAALRLDLRLAALRREIDAVDSLRDEIAAVTQSGEQGVREDPALGAPHALWARQRRQALNMDLAGHLAATEAAQREAAIAFGQREALRQLGERKVEEARLQRSRRT